ncbi:MAG: histidine kinase [Pedosphaera sp.]|nr:histidine kinase [Pedosphaera sp.]
MANSFHPHQDPPLARLRWWHPPAYLGLWLFIGLTFAGQSYLAQAKRGLTVSWDSTLAGATADWLCFALLALPAIFLAKKFTLAGPHWRLRLFLHFLASIVFSLAWMLLRAGLEQILPARGRALPFAEILRYVLVATFFFNLLVYWVVTTGTHAVAYYQSFREREVRVLELEQRLATARLHALQMQLNPHFLFNALQGISTLMYRDVDSADSLLVKLSELLRHALDRDHEQRVTLADELAFLDRYLALEQMRFGDRLTVEREISPESLDALVPNLILQPLVENAIQHGLEPQIRPGKIVIQSHVLQDRVILRVTDNGRGLEENVIPGIGTTNTIARLRQLYGPRASFTLESAPEGGTCARVELPLDTRKNPRHVSVV